MPTPLGCFRDDASQSSSGMEETSCLLQNTGILMELDAPVAITPVQPWTTWPDYDREERCVDRSENPTWEIHDLSFDHAKRRDSARAAYSLSFNVTSQSTDSRVSCSVEIDEGMSLALTNTEHWLDCAIPGGFSLTSDIISTQAMFDVDYGLLGIKQVWKCPDAVRGIDPYAPPQRFSLRHGRAVPRHFTFSLVGNANRLPPCQERHTVESAISFKNSIAAPGLRIHTPALSLQ